MSGFSNLLILGAIGAGVAYFTDCFQYCSGFKGTVDGFIDSIMGGGGYNTDDNNDADYTSYSYHALAAQGANARNHMEVVDYKRLLPKPRPIARFNPLRNNIDSLPSSFGDPIDPIIRPVFAGRDAVSFRNAKNLDVANSVIDTSVGRFGFGFRGVNR